jgi:hypothetical protein
LSTCQSGYDLLILVNPKVEQPNFSTHHASSEHVSLICPTLDLEVKV